MQVRRDVFFTHYLRERFELGIKKAAMRGFFSSRVVRRVRVAQPESGNALENFV
jgi:hypothetical protein